MIERVRQVASVRSGADAGRHELESALRAGAQVRAWLAAADAELTRRLSSEVSSPEHAIADCTRTSLGEALKLTERAETLAAVPSFAAALDDAAVTASHVDAVTRAGKGLADAQRDRLYERVADLVDVASVATVRQFARRLDHEVRALQRDDGMDRLERQRRAARLRTWVDGEGMWCLSGRFDPLSGVRLASRLEAGVRTLFADRSPATSPVDPLEKQRHLAALSLVHLVCDADGSGGVKPGRPEYVVVIDASQPYGAGGPTVDWGIPVDVPQRVLAELTQAGDVTTVVVRNGVVLHAPGELDLGRATRLANRAQRRALRAMYATCAIPGCEVSFDRCKLHHLVWWRHGGRTDLQNLIPLCPRHHARVHDHGWELVLGPDRALTIRFPDGTVRNTGPPSRRTAA